MKTARLTTLLTIFFAFMCVLQFYLIANNLDKTRAQLSDRKSAGEVNSLIQVDRNLDHFIFAITEYIHASKAGADTEKAVSKYQSDFDIFWASTSIIEQYFPENNERQAVFIESLEEVKEFLDTNDPFIFGDNPLSVADADRIYEESKYISDLYHKLGLGYFVALSEFNDQINSSTDRIYWAFYFFAIMLLCTGSFSAYSLVMANKKANALVVQSEKNQQKLTQLVNELRSGRLENKAKDSFIAAASHDLRQPLHALGLFLGALERHVQPAGRTVMEKAQQSSAALTKLLSSLLDLSRLDAGVVKVSEKDFPVAGLLSTLEQEFQSTAKERDMALVFDISNDLVRTDRILLGRILRNLIENALTHSKGSVLSVSSKSDKDSVLITVSDNGRGIPQSKHSHIFSEYYQIGNPERDRSKGLGIGLSIVYRLSELLGLELDFSSDVDSGCTFTLNIPLGVPMNLTQNDPLYNDASQATATGQVIAVIEDEIDIREGMEIMLSSKGYPTIATESADTMINQLLKEGIVPDLLITDYRLRDNNTGDEAIEKVFAALGTVLPAIIITGDTSPNRVKEASQSGYALLHKPVEPADLLAVIDDLLKQKDQALAACEAGAMR